MVLITPRPLARSFGRYEALRQFIGLSTFKKTSQIEHPLGKPYSACEIGPTDIGLAKIGTCEISLAEKRIAEISPSQIGIAEISLTKIGIAEVCPGEFGTIEIGVTKVSKAEIGESKIGIAEIRSTEICTIKIGACEVGPAEIGFAEIRPYVGAFANKGRSPDENKRQKEAFPNDANFTVVSFARTPIHLNNLCVRGGFLQETVMPVGSVKRYT